jgi:hypothetical protein
VFGHIGLKDVTVIGAEGVNISPEMRHDAIAKARRAIDVSFAAKKWPPKATAPEPEHQNYLERHPEGYSCHFVRRGWKRSCCGDLYWNLPSVSAAE